MAKAKHTLPDWEYLEECFTYNNQTGMLYWKHRPLDHFLDQHAADVWNARFPGQVAGGTTGRYGYRLVTLNGRQTTVHRIVWKLITDTDPPEIDHINGIRDDNRWCNLRAVAGSENKWNRRCDHRNQFGLKGVERSPKSSRFRAKIRIEGKPTRLGTFATPEEAHAAYCEAARKHFGEFWSQG